MPNLSDFREAVLNFINDNKEYRSLVLLAAGLYPFFQYYSNNISEATSWQQLLFIAGICFVLPQISKVVWSYVSRLKLFKPIKSYGLSILNSVLFSGLIGFLVLNLSNKKLLLVLVVAFILGFIIAKHIKKVVVIQVILAIISSVGLAPKLMFELKQDNETWAKISKEELNTTFVKTPNIFVIQPDGYANFMEMSEPPYNFNNENFEDWLGEKGFANYNNFRSNYYSTYTSNASMFAMQHHYYSNTNRATLKTHKANEVIVGKYNNALSIFKRNNYKTHLITDNSYFLIDREPLEYNYCNIKPSQLSFHNSGLVGGVDLISDLEKVLDTLPKKNNFFFIEKTIPSHIMYSERLTKGKTIERLEYLERVELANEWLKSLVNHINEFDDEAIIIIVADHGGLVGLDYTLEAVNRKLNNLETRSTFTSMLSIKWSKYNTSKELSYKSNVNLFRNLFYVLSENEDLLKNSEDNSSYLPLKENGKANYYQYIDDKGNFVFNKVSP